MRIKNWFWLFEYDSSNFQNRDHVAGMAYGSRTYAASAGMDESRVGIVSEPRSELKDGIDTQGQSALELATTSR